MLNVSESITCGGLVVDAVIPRITSILVTGIQIAVPLLLIIFGMLDMAKAVMGADEKAMKESQGKLIKRIVYAIVVFLIVALVKTVFSVLGSVGKSDDAASCIDCFVSNNCVEVADN